MSVEVTTELEEWMDSLDFTPSQRVELLSNPELARKLIESARPRRLSSPAGWILNKFRLGEVPPDANAWRGGEEDDPPDYNTLLRCCEKLVRHTGHEYRDDDLLEEFKRLSGLSKVGNGAVLTDADRDRLLADAQTMRVRAALPSEPPAPIETPPELREARARFGGPEATASGVDRLLSEMERMPPGKCGDCGEYDDKAPRFRYGKFVLCGACVEPRLRVKVGGQYERRTA